MAIHGRGYINVAGCSHGTGDPYFIRARDEDDPAVIQVAHDVSDDPELILRDGVFVVAGRSRSYSLTHSWAMPESAKHNDGCTRRPIAVHLMLLA